MSTTTITIDGTDIQVEQLGTPLAFTRKPRDLGELSGSDGTQVVYVTETREMSPAEFDAFGRDLLRSRPWLAGKGGYYGKGRLCIEVCAPDRPRLYVDPSGGDYARYVARLG
jgi:hypothetical protein